MSGASDSMRRLHLCILVIGICVLMTLAFMRPNVLLDRSGLNAERGLSSWLSYQIQYHPPKGAEEAKFTAKLTNISPFFVHMYENTKRLHATLTVTPKASEPFEIMDRDYWNLLTTSTWSDPIVYLAPSRTLTWILPLSSLVSSGNPVTEEMLAGCTVDSEMGVSLCPALVAYGRHVGGNASQNSAPITIPARPGQMLKLGF